MKRVEIDYLGKSYTLPETTAAHVREEISSGLEAGNSFWLRVNFGEGKPQPVDLLITRGVGITVADANVDEVTGDIPDLRPLFDTNDHVVRSGEPSHLD
jgi:hypothetical protein